MNSKGRPVAVLGLIVFALAMLHSCSAPVQGPLTATIYPNLAQARAEGFYLLAGHPPFRVDFHVEVEGGDGVPSYEWDLDGDGASDSDAADPEFTYTRLGEYVASVSIRDGRGQTTLAEQRIVVIGEPEWPDWRFGVVTHLDKSQSDAEAQKEAQMITESGIEAARLDLTWRVVQPDDKDEYEWEKYDSLVALSRRYGFELLPIIGYSSEWASTAEDAASWEEVISGPPVPAEYAWFAYSAADRYKADIQAWEVWNEPNHSHFWNPEPDPAGYVELLKQAYLAIKYADPQAVVVLGGLANGESGSTLRYPPEEFLQVVYDQGGGPYFDAVGRHPYAYPSDGTEHLIRLLDDLRIVMTDNGDGEKPIWLTEYGAPTDPLEGITEEVQGRWLTQSLDALSFSNSAAPVFWYDFRDGPNDEEQTFGLVKEDFEVKPAYRAYEDYIRKNR